MILRKITKILLIQVAFCLFMATSIFAQDQEKATLLFEDAELGVKIAGPEGWYLTSGQEVKEKTKNAINDMTRLDTVKESFEKIGILVTYSKYPVGASVEANPNIVLTAEPLNPQYSQVIKTAVDYANASILTLKAILKDFKLLEDPYFVMVNGRQGAHFTYEGTMTMGYLELRCKCSAYLFLKDNIVYAISLTDKADDFDNVVDKFESTVQSFHLN